MFPFGEVIMIAPHFLSEWLKYRVLIISIIWEKHIFDMFSYKIEKKWDKWNQENSLIMNVKYKYTKKTYQLN